MTEVAYYVIAEPGKDGKPVSYLHAVAAKVFAADPTYRLATELGHAGQSSSCRKPEMSVLPGNVNLFS
jgi:hypothetical protein